jgi:hypothetical protein
MKFSSSVVALAAICSSAMIGSSSAFVVRSPAVVNVQYASLMSSRRTQPGWSNHPSTSSAPARSSVRMYEGANDDDDDPANEIARLKSMAAKLRAEASALEVSQVNAHFHLLYSLKHIIFIASYPFSHITVEIIIYFFIYRQTRLSRWLTQPKRLSGNLTPTKTVSLMFLN